MDRRPGLGQATAGRLGFSPPLPESFPVWSFFSPRIPCSTLVRTGDLGCSICIDWLLIAGGVRLPIGSGS